MKNISHEEILSKVKEILIETQELSLAPHEIPGDEMLFSTRIGLDSHGVMSLILALENSFSVDIDDLTIITVGLETVDNLVDIVQSAISKST